MLRTPLLFHSCPALLGSDVGRFVIITTAFENVFAPVMVCAGEINTVSDVAAPASVLNSAIRNALTVVDPPDVDAADSVTVVPDRAAVKDN